MEKLLSTILNVCVLFTIICAKSSRETRFKRNVDEFGLVPFSLDDDESCFLADSCIVDNVSSSSITVRWPCCAGTSFEVTHKPQGFSRSQREWNCNCDEPSRSMRMNREIEERKEKTKSFSTNNCFMTLDDFCPYGDYQIDVISGDQSCSLTQTTVPAVPKWKETKAIAEDKIHLSWHDTYCTDNKIPIYRITWHGPDGLETTEDIYAKAYELSLLSSHTKYTIKLRACDNHNHKHDDRFCSVNRTAEVLTKSGSPSEPRNMSATALNSSSILLEWFPPEVPRGPIDGYNVTCRKGRRIVLNTSVFGINTTSYLVTRLQLWTRYTCVVRAFNVDSGTILLGNEKTVFTVTKPSHPSSPIDLKAVKITSDEIRLSWKQPNFPQGPLDGFIVVVESDKEKREELVSSSTHELSFKNLSSGSNYNATVIAFNYDTDGAGRTIETILLNGTRASVVTRTNAGAPGPPRDVRVAKVTSEHIFLKWKRPTVTRGPIDGYVIQVLTDESEIVLSGSSLFHYVTNLSPAMNYTVAIFAFNMEAGKRLDGEAVVFFKSTKPVELSPVEILEQYRKDMVLQLSQMNRILNETLATLGVHGEIRPIR